MSDVENISKVQPAKATKRRNLRVAERMKLIEDYKNGITDRYYYVSPHPKKQGEYIIRKRRTPLTYDIPSEKRKQADTDNTPDVLTPTPSEMLKPTPPPSTPSMASGPTPSIEFFSMQSNLNANIQRELDALYEKYNKLDAKLRKERAAKREMSKSKSKTHLMRLPKATTPQGGTLAPLMTPKLNMNMSTLMNHHNQKHFKHLLHKHSLHAFHMHHTFDVNVLIFETFNTQPIFASAKCLGNELNDNLIILVQWKTAIRE